MSNSILVKIHEAYSDKKDKNILVAPPILAQMAEDLGMEVVYDEDNFYEQDLLLLKEKGDMKREYPDIQMRITDGDDSVEVFAKAGFSNPDGSLSYKVMIEPKMKIKQCVAEAL